MISRAAPQVPLGQVHLAAAADVALRVAVGRHVADGGPHAIPDGVDTVLLVAGELLAVAMKSWSGLESLAMPEIVTTPPSLLPESSTISPLLLGRP